MKTYNMKKLNEKVTREFPGKKLMLGHGKLNSKIVLVGEAPGAKEIELGKPFAGQSGKYLDEFLRVLNINKDDIYITNAVKYRPIKENIKTNRVSNRTPSMKEIDNFKEYLYKEIAIINPELIVTLGNIPLSSICNQDLRIGDIHGELIEKGIGANVYKVFPLYHPAAIIYRPGLKDIYMGDLNKLKEILGKDLKRY